MSAIVIFVLKIMREFNINANSLWSTIALVHLFFCVPTHTENEILCTDLYFRRIELISFCIFYIIIHHDATRKSTTLPIL